MQANLGVALRTRFETLGQVADLDAAIAAYGKALAVAREGSPDWAMDQANLGVALRTRFEALGQGADLDAAIEAYGKALSVAREGSPDWAKMQANLGVALRTRFETLGQVADLDAAIAAFHKALSVAREGSPDWARWQANLGSALIRRFEALGQVADLDAAIEAYEKALAVAREGSPDWAKMQANLGVALRTRFETLGQVADLDAAIAAYEQALAVFTPEAFPDYTLTAALPLIHLLMRRRGKNDMERVAAAGARAVPAWQYLYFESLHESRKQRQLRRAQGLWANDAFALARLGRAGEAVAVLETGRARQLAETFRARQALETLQSPALAGAWRAVKEAESRYHHAPEAKRPAAEADLARRRQEYYARLREHFPDYFAEPAFADVQAAARPSPTVYLLSTPAGGLALVVTGEGARAVDLPELTETTLNGWLVKTDEAGQNVIGGYLPAQLGYGSMDKALEEVLPALGKALQPLVEALTPSPQPPSPLPNLRPVQLPASSEL
jgi:tetratricopeptide (TPR) repeat protein